MSQQKSKKTLINWDLVSVNPNDKNWNWKDLFCFWGVNIQSVIGFSLISSLYVTYNLTIGMGNGFRSGVAVYRDINSGGFSQLDTVRANTDGSSQRLTNVTNGANQWSPETVGQTFLDSPSYSVGNAISYKLYTWSESNGTIYINRLWGHDSSNSSYAVGVSTMTLMEVAA